MSILSIGLITAGMLLVNYVLMGLPVILVYGPGSIFIKIIIGREKYDKMHDEVWPCLLTTGMIWPLFFPLWYYLAYKVIDISLKKVWVLVLGFAITGMLISILIFLFMSRNYSAKKKI